MDKKRISLLINSIEAGGAERVATSLLFYLKDDFEIHLVLLNNTIEYILPAGQTVYCFNQPYGENSILKILKLPILAHRYKQYCKKNNINGSLSFLGRSNYVNCLSKMLGLKCKVIISERTFLSGYLNSIGKIERFFAKWLAKIFYPKADLIVPNSKLTKVDLRNTFKIVAEYKVINNPIDINNIHKLSIAGVDQSLFNSFTFVHAGRLQNEKNHSLLLHSFNKMESKNCNLLLLGKGNQEDYIRKLVNELGLKSRVTLVGFDENPYKYFSRSQCFVLSSNFEGFPNAIIEALACGIPVVSTDCSSGPREILAPATDVNNKLINEIEIAEFGILVPVKNVDLLTKAMDLIYNDAALRNIYKEKAIKRAKQFDVDIIISQFKEILV